MTEYIIENKNLKVTVSSYGAEIISVISKEDGKEHIWNANPGAWKRHAPVLFPLVGKYKDDKSKYNDKEYSMTQHGFARDMEFELLSKSENSISMNLLANDETFKKYPFDFELICTYVLKDNSIFVGWNVVNKGNETMYFSIGGHPAFIGSNDTLKDASIVFNDVKDEITYRLLNDKGLIVRNDFIMNLTADGSVKLSEDFFDRDAYVFENSQSKSISLVEDGKKIVTVNFDAPVFGIWSAAKKNVPFVCIEPWYGRTDGEDFDGDITSREWGNVLNAGSTFNERYEIVIENI